MLLIHSLYSIAAEPASILYMVTGAVGFATAALRKTNTAADKTSVALLFCRRTSHTLLKSLNLF